MGSQALHLVLVINDPITLHGPFMVRIQAFELLERALFHSQLHASR